MMTRITPAARRTRPPKRMERAKEVDALLQMYKPKCCQTPLMRKKKQVPHDAQGDKGL